MKSCSFSFCLIIILLLFTILNMMYVGVSWHRKEVYACSTDRVIEGVAKYFRSNGNRALEQELKEPCKNNGPSSDSQEQLESVIRNVVRVCESRREQKKNISLPLLILITTWTNTSDDSKDIVHNITIQNWLTFKPKVEVVVFTNDTAVVNLAESWDLRTFPILHHGGGGAPVLKTMFTTVMKQYESSHLFGYVNSDIIFTQGLTDTLEHILHVRQSKPSYPLLVIGKRTNIQNVSPAEVKTYSDIENIARNRGQLYYPYAEDFFITNNAFPWDDIVDVVVGRVAYDNWLVGHAICNLHADVIDVSQTVLAVHQTTEKGGNSEGLKHKFAHYNEELFKKLKILPAYESGFTLCAKQSTYMTLCDDVEITQRNSFWDRCKCPDLQTPVTTNTTLPI